MKDEHWESAFPSGNSPDAGMGIRDYFAAKAMQAFISNASAFSHITNHDACAKEAYLAAEAMMKERNE